MGHPLNQALRTNLSTSQKALKLRILPSKLLDVITSVKKNLIIKSLLATLNDFKPIQALPLILSITLLLRNLSWLRHWPKISLAQENRLVNSEQKRNPKTFFSFFNNFHFIILKTSPRKKQFY
jgi:hypothetical protein